MYERNYYFDEKDFKLINDDVFEATKHMQEKTFDMIFADPPYFLSNNGITCSGGKMVSVNKGEWDKELSLQEKHEFNRKWIKECYRLLKDEGTIWISGTLHNIYSIGMALEEEGFKIINNITWQKTNPPPNLACKTFTHSTETVLWARKDIKKAKYKLIGQFMASIIVVFYGGLLLKDISFFGFNMSFNWVSYPLTILFILGCINCLNLIDGLDGLASGICLIILVVIASLSVIS